MSLTKLNLTTKSAAAKKCILPANDPKLLIKIGSGQGKYKEYPVFISTFDHTFENEKEDGTKETIEVKAGDQVFLPGSFWSYKLADGKLDHNQLVVAEYFGCLKPAQWAKIKKEKGWEGKPTTVKQATHRYSAMMLEDTDDNIEQLTEELGINPRDYYVDEPVAYGNVGKAQPKPVIEPVKKSEDDELPFEDEDLDEFLS